ncbi:AraC family transcriptional regulator [Marinomonas sp. CT5]|uniref:helix-turn-helix domain-containing protein n=1 Tax=Marinomonas sp. CT5 TaxID=2066133 RepID=UPI0017C1DF90|nr:helix-turn-helix domain-containing protein [Marinomonas sp. CT5]NVK71898.1 helix-turn-helix domain-containing protein [Oceanospirillaceae bacterium]QUX94262.1 AraC family transcriptional regulator [Marinomonas sp. CT5]
MLNSKMDAPKGGDFSAVSRVCVSEAYDADLHASNLTNWQQEYDQTSRGGFYGCIVELPFDGLQVFCEHTSQALQQKCVVWPDSVWLGIPLADQGESRINGLTINENNIMCRPGDCDFQLSTPQDYDLYGLVVDQSKLIKMAAIHGVDINWKELTEYGRLGVPDKTLEEVRFVLARLLSVQNKESSPRLQQELVMIALLEVLKMEIPQPAKTQSYCHRKKVVDVARQFLDQHLDEPVTVTQLCEITNVSRRTLQYSFESILGVSPIQYLRISRLNGVRRSLVQAKNGQAVSDIAAQWGFWHLSQFAKDYKQLFGEQPSQTLEWRG